MIFERTVKSHSHISFPWRLRILLSLENIVGENVVKDGEDIVEGIVEIDCISGCSVVLAFVLENISVGIVVVKILISSVSFDKFSEDGSSSLVVCICMVESIDSLQSVSFIQIDISSILVISTILIYVRNSNKRKNIIGNYCLYCINTNILSKLNLFTDFLIEDRLHMHFLFFLQ